MEQQHNNQCHTLEETLQYRFKRTKLLQTALCHSSYANENNTTCNERMEFLGDAVLELCVSQHLYQLFSTAREGELTRLRAKLVNETALAHVARQINLGAHLLLGKGEEAQGGREKNSVLSDAFEAIIGAIYLDDGFDAAYQVICNLFADSWPQALNLQKTKDAKTRLQEKTQNLYGDRPYYRLLKSQGPEHAKEYTICVTLPDGRSLEATGASLKKAEQQSAAQALLLLSKDCRSKNK